MKVRFGIQQPMPKKFYECGENPRKVKNAGDLCEYFWLPSYFLLRLKVFSIDFPLPKKKDIQAPIDFTLPYDIFFQCCMETLLDKARKTWTDRAQCPEPFIVQTKTVFSDISTRKPGYHERCQCDPKGSDCDDSCINRMMFVECTLKNCSLRGKCTNRVISSKNWCKVSAKQCGDKGWGLFAEEFIPKSRFIIEYVGEMISSAECEHRISMHYADETKFYMLSLESSDVIDATRFGSFARFTNHSCDPNAACQNWFVKDRSRIGIFAIRDISKGEEITFNYQFQRFGDVKHKCLCGSSKCRGYLGAKNPPRRNVAKSSIKEIKRFDQEALSLENSKSLITLLNSDDVPEDSNPFRHHSIPTFLARNLEEGKNYRKEQLREKFSADDCKNLINAFK